MTQKDATSASTDTSPLDIVRQRADAMYRAASECCRQHDRFARVVEKSMMPAEQRAAQRIVTLCDEALQELVAAYEKCAARVHPEDDEAWWHRANSLWHASREYMRRHLVGDRMGREVGTQHSPGMLGELHVEYELEASALLALRHATDAYRKTRPDAH